ncbi:hypothetical protein KF840_22390 [bacterium]|nr:hypothetical protein [bacterium]
MTRVHRLAAAQRSGAAIAGRAGGCDAPAMDWTYLAMGAGMILLMLLLTSLID